MFRFGWVIAAAEDLQIWLRFPEATFALYEVPGAEGASEYRSVRLIQTSHHKARSGRRGFH